MTNHGKTTRFIQQTTFFTEPPAQTIRADLVSHSFPLSTVDATTSLASLDCTQLKTSDKTRGTAAGQKNPANRETSRYCISRRTKETSRKRNEDFFLIGRRSNRSNNRL